MEKKEQPTKTETQPMKILLAYDGSEHAQAAVDLLCDLPLKRPSVTLLAVLRTQQITGHETMQHDLDQTQARLETRKMQATSILKVGHPAATINDYAEEIQTDLILMGAKGLRATLGIFLGGVAVLLVAVLVYPLGATPTKVAMRFHSSPPTLDGMAYMETAVLQDQNRDVQLGGDYEALLWLQDHIAGSPTVLEAQIPEYRWGSRVSIYTGLPTVLGWTWHQRQQRGSYGWMIDRRLADIKTMFDSANAATASALMRRYDVRLIYVGGLERAYYSAAGLAKFDQMVASGDLSVIYRANGVTVYEVKSGNRPDLVISTPARSGGG